MLEQLLGTVERLHREAAVAAEILVVALARQVDGFVLETAVQLELRYVEHASRVARQSRALVVVYELPVVCGVAAVELEVRLDIESRDRRFDHVDVLVVQVVGDARVVQRVHGAGVRRGRELQGVVDGACARIASAPIVEVGLDRSFNADVLADVELTARVFDASDDAHRTHHRIADDLHVLQGERCRARSVALVGHEEQLLDRLVPEREGDIVVERRLGIDAVDGHVLRRNDRAVCGCRSELHGGHDHDGRPRRKAEELLDAIVGEHRVIGACACVRIVARSRDDALIVGVADRHVGRVPVDELVVRKRDDAISGCRSGEGRFVIEPVGFDIACACSLAETVACALGTLGAFASACAARVTVVRTVSAFAVRRAFGRTASRFVGRAGRRFARSARSIRVSRGLREHSEPIARLRTRSVRNKRASGVRQRNNRGCLARRRWSSAPARFG